MAVIDYKDLLRHLTHKVEVVDYSAQGGEIANVAIECLKCDEVLVDYDNPDWVNPDG